MKTAKQYADKFNEQVIEKMSQYGDEPSFFKEFPMNISAFGMKVMNGLLLEFNDNIGSDDLTLPIEVGLQEEYNKINKKYKAISILTEGKLNKEGFSAYFADKFGDKEILCDIKL